MSINALEMSKLGEYKAQGMKDAKLGKDVSENPYAGPLARQHWEKGFNLWHEQKAKEEK